MTTEEAFLDALRRIALALERIVDLAEKEMEE
jgi:hypothetical protein